MNLKISCRFPCCYFLYSDSVVLKLKCPKIIIQGRISEKMYATFHGKILALQWVISTASKFSLYTLALKKLKTWLYHISSAGNAIPFISIPLLCLNDFYHMSLSLESLLNYYFTFSHQPKCISYLPFLYSPMEDSLWLSVRYICLSHCL